MSTPYIPAKDADLLAWSDNFAALITASPSTYGLVAGDAAAINAVNTPWDAAYAAAVSPATRGPMTVQDKNSAKAALLAVCRPYALQVRNNAGVSDADKVALGLTVPSTSRTPILAPQTQPLIQIVAATPLSHTLRFSDSNSPQLRGKPFGAKACAFVVSYATTIGTDPDAASPVAIVNSALAVPSSTGLATRQPAASVLPVAQVGKLATYWARWVGIRGDVGPWSLPVAMTVSNIAVPA